MCDDGHRHLIFTRHGQHLSVRWRDMPGATQRLHRAFAARLALEGEGGGGYFI